MPKTLFEDTIDDVFLKSLQKTPRPKTQQTHIANFFYICASPQNKKYFKYYFELQDNFIFCKKSQ